MGVWRWRPEHVPRQSTPTRCWATAVSLWTRVTPGVDKLDEDAVVEEFRDQGVVNEDDSLMPVPGLRVVARHFSLRAELVRGGGTLSLDRLGPKLRKSHVLLVFRDPGSHFDHMVVVYGVDQLYVCFMDPFGGRRERVRIWDFPPPGVNDLLLLWRE